MKKLKYPYRPILVTTDYGKVWLVWNRYTLEFFHKVFPTMLDAIKFVERRRKADARYGQ